MAAILAPAAVPAAAAVNATAEAVAGGAAGVEESLFGSKERGDRSPALLRLNQLSMERRCWRRHSLLPPRSCCWRSLYGCFPAHGGCVLCVIPRQMLYHPGDRRRGPVNICGVTSGGVLSSATRVIIRFLV